MSSNGNNKNPGSTENGNNEFNFKTNIRNTSKIKNKKDKLSDKIEKSLKNIEAELLQDYQINSKKIADNQINILKKLNTLKNNEKNVTTFDNILNENKKISEQLQENGNLIQQKINELQDNYTESKMSERVTKNLNNNEIELFNTERFKGSLKESNKRPNNSFNQKIQEMIGVYNKLLNNCENLKNKYISIIQQKFTAYKKYINQKTIGPLQKLSTTLTENMNAISEILTQLANKKNLNQLPQIDLKNKYPAYVELRDNYLKLYENLGEVQQQYSATLGRLNDIITNLGGTTTNILTNQLNEVKNKKQNIKLLNQKITNTIATVQEKLTTSKDKYKVIINQIIGLCDQLKNASNKYTQLKNFYNNEQLKKTPFKEILKKIEEQTKQLNTQLKNSSCKNVFKLFKTGNGTGTGNGNGNGNGESSESIQATSVNKTGNKNNENAHRQLRNLFSTKSGSVFQNLKKLIKNKPQNNNSNQNKKQQFMTLLTKAMEEVAKIKNNPNKKLHAKKHLIKLLINEMGLSENNRKNILEEKNINSMNNDELENLIQKLAKTQFPTPPPTNQQQQQQETPTATTPPSPPIEQQETMPPLPPKEPLRQNQLKKNILKKIKNNLPEEYSNKNKNELALNLLTLISKNPINLRKTNFESLVKNKNSQLTPIQIKSLYEIQQEYWKEVSNKFM